jgi:DeoR/GlpR family transcriptional regulator of sugar metabolism
VGKEHRLAERRQSILTAIDEIGQVSVARLSARFDVSTVTIRQDLQALSEQGLILRTRGGALSSNSLPEFSFDIRQQQQAAQKTRIGRAAAGLISHGDVVVLDASTTAYAILPFIKKFSELTVITNSLRVATNLLDAPQIHVMLMGGSLRRASISLVGQPQCNWFESIHIQAGFFGARGFTLAEGLTDVNTEEVLMKRAMVGRCQQVVGVLDSRKWGKVSAVTFARLDQISAIITDKSACKAAKDMIDRIRQHNIDVTLV